MSTFGEAVGRIMSTPVVTVAASAQVSIADGLLRQHRISCLAVLGDGGELEGALSRKDLLRAGKSPSAAEGGPSLSLPVAEVRRHATRPCRSVPPEATVRQAARALVDAHIHRVFVEVGRRPVGVFSTREAMSAVLEERVATPISSFMNAPVIGVEADSPIADGLALLERGGVGGVVVTEGGFPVGVFTEVEALGCEGLTGTTAIEEVMSQSLLCLPPETPLHRAAGFSLATRARRILVVDHRHVRGILTGLDFARVVAGPVSE